MMILDLSQVVLSSLHVALGKHASGDIDMQSFRNMVSNVLRSLRVKYKGSYGDLIIASDAKAYWRRDVFPSYKFRRRAKRKASGLNWTGIYECMDTMRTEIQAHFPYKYISVERAEADDIIGTLVLGTQEKVLILSGDRDFIQLHRPNVKQYDPVAKTDVVAPIFPEKYLFEHIVRGDPGDDIPNIASPDNTFVMGKRQRRLTKKFWETLGDPSLEDNPYHERWVQNRQLIDLTQIPVAIQESIREAYAAPHTKSKLPLLNFFTSHAMNEQIDRIHEF